MHCTGDPVFSEVSERDAFCKFRRVEVEDMEGDVKLSFLCVLQSNASDHGGESIGTYTDPRERRNIDG